MTNKYILKGRIGMKTFNYTITDAVGIHARPAGKLVKLAKGFESKITIEKEGGKSADLTKLMAVMGLGVKCGDNIIVTFDGADEEAAFTAVTELISAEL